MSAIKTSLEYLVRKEKDKDDLEVSFGGEQSDHLRLRKKGQKELEDMKTMMIQARDDGSVEKIDVSADPSFPKFLLEYNQKHKKDDPLSEPTELPSCYRCHMKKLRKGCSKARCKLHRQNHTASTKKSSKKSNK